MTVKEYLHQAYRLDQRIKSDTMEAQNLREMAGSVSAIQYDKDRVQTSRNTDAPFVRTLEKLWELDNCICRCEGEIVLILCIRLGSGREDDSVTQVTRRMAVQWNIPDDQLLMNALHRSNKLMPARLYHEVGHQYHLTTESGDFGATAFFYPGIRDWVATKVKSDYYIGFFGDHEALIHSVFHRRLCEMQTAILEYNSIMNFRRCLTDRIYRYDAVCGRLMEV